MNIRQDKLFLDGASAAAESKAALLENESVLTLEVTGTATEFTLKVMGRAADGQEQWIPLAAINLTDFSVSDVISKTGIYSAALDGLRGVKLVLESAAGGTVSAYGRMGE